MSQYWYTAISWSHTVFSFSHFPTLQWLTLSYIGFLSVWQFHSLLKSWFNDSILRSVGSGIWKSIFLLLPPFLFLLLLLPISSPLTITPITTQILLPQSPALYGFIMMPTVRINDAFTGFVFSNRNPIQGDVYQASLPMTCLVVFSKLALASGFWEEALSSEIPALRCLLSHTMSVLLPTCQWLLMLLVVTGPRDSNLTFE